MKIGIVKEIHPGERRVAATPDTAKRLKSFGFDVLVETGAGLAAEFANIAYTDVGCDIAPDAASVWSEADIVLKVRPPAASEVPQVRSGGTLISFLYPAQNKELVEQLAARKATVLAMDAVPRISRAQKLDALSSMANISGYRAIIEAANNFGRFFTGQITAAGKVPPAKVLIIGAGVAGLAAIGTAKGLGAVVRARSTPAPSSRSRSRAWAPSSCSSTSKRTAPARAATPSR
jgi:NAD(P) transhydrogenase subunit alpha